MQISDTDGQLTISGDLIDAVGLPYDPILEPTSLDNFALWITIGEERYPLEITFFPNETGQYAWFRSRLAVAERMDRVARAH